MKPAHSKADPAKPALSKKLLRSLPTLTEVVATPPAPAAAAVPGQIDEEALVERVRQRMELSLQAQIQTAVAAALEAQMKELGPRIRQRVDNAVRKAVTQAVAAELQPQAGRAD